VTVLRHIEVMMSQGQGSAGCAPGGWDFAAEFYRWRAIQNKTTNSYVIEIAF
jgi:hypothetical protein